MRSQLHAEDRNLVVEPGQVVQTGYVPVERVKLACKERMAMGDVENAYRRILQLDGAQAWPPPVGYWEEGPERQFVILDGRHAFVAYLMLGYSRVLVAWLMSPP